MLRSYIGFIERHQQWFRLPMVGVLAVLAVLLALIRPAFIEQIEFKTLDERFLLRGPRTPSVPVVIVAVDDASLDAVGRWPWPRDKIGAIVERVLEHDHARALGFDMVFSEAQTNPVTETLRLMQAQGQRVPPVADWLASHRQDGDLDRHFEALLERFKDRVALGYFFYPEGSNPPVLIRRRVGQEMAMLQPSAISVSMTADAHAPMPRIAAIEGNIPGIMHAAEVAGFFNFLPDRDGMVRRVPLVATYDGMVYPSLDLQLLRIALGWPTVSAHVTDAGVEYVSLGKHVVHTDLGGGMLLNHYGPAHSFRHVPAIDVLEGRENPDLFNNAIVLLGVTAVGVYDQRSIPFDATFPGVEAHAAAITNMLSGTEIHRPPTLGILEVLLVLLLSLGSGWLACRRGPIMQSSLLLGVPLLILSVGFWVFVEYNIWLKVSYLVIGVLMTTLPVTLTEYAVEARRRGFIHDAFSRYLAPEVVANLARYPEGLRLGGEERVLTAVFSDIAGFSSFSETLPPDRLVKFLNQYLTAMSDIILAHGGTIDKYEGDAIIAFFGAPVELEDHARRAVTVALAQQRRLAELRSQWLDQGYPEVHMRIGINTGNMVVGNMGTESHMDYTIMGDHVNLASRLEGVCKVYRVPILISRDSYMPARDEIAARFIDRIQVVGRKQVVDVFEPLGFRRDVGEARLRFARNYEKAWELMRDRKFAESEEILEDLVALHPDDGPSVVMLERVRAFRKQDPGSTWTGVHILESK
ncbi:MAG TPA: adenylate/guanylate cyclase domain-containing protein [Mariprofundaceae bacterium]|nr:adenylate/guanylate cyclase domain-containing protein [Mariprofundaceae bacterium]